jgi:hypothetical protein
MTNNLCKTVLSNGGTVSPLIIPSNETSGTGLMNPSVIIDGDNIIVNIRHINYTLYHCEGEQLFYNRYGPLVYINPENDIKLKTNNYICLLDNELNIINYYKVDTSKCDIIPKWDFHGLEDARLIKWDDILYLSGVRRDTTDNGEGRIELSEIDIQKNKVIEISRNRIEPPTQSYCEKNWMPIIDMPFHYVKWCNPTEVIKVDIETKSSSTIYISDNKIIDVDDIRGGSQVINYKENRIACVHNVKLWNNRIGQKDGIYTHRFIIWDKNWNIIYLSDEFSFLDTSIEFCCGMTFYNGNLLMTFGFQDNAAYIIRIPENIVDNLIYGKL